MRKFFFTNNFLKNLAKKIIFTEKIFTEKIFFTALFFGVDLWREVDHVKEKKRRQSLVVDSVLRPVVKKEGIDRCLRGWIAKATPGSTAGKKRRQSLADRVLRPRVKRRDRPPLSSAAGRG